jgi:hypothetical protein
VQAKGKRRAKGKQAEVNKKLRKIYLEKMEKLKIRSV